MRSLSPKDRGLPMQIRQGDWKRVLSKVPLWALGFNAEALLLHTSVIEARVRVRLAGLNGAVLTPRTRPVGSHRALNSLSRVLCFGRGFLGYVFRYIAGFLDDFGSSLHSAFAGVLGRLPDLAYRVLCVAAQSCAASRDSKRQYARYR